MVFLLFNPCFFRPHPEKLPRQYQFSTEFDDFERKCELNPAPNFDSIVRQAQNEFPNRGEHLQYANSQYIWAVVIWAARESEPKECARSLFSHINLYLNQVPRDKEWPFTLRSLGDLELWE